MITGWDRIESHWWPTIADALPKPWSVEAACMDLRWWSGRVRAGAYMPGRPALAKRWGWPDRKARSLMADTVRWADPKHGDVVQRRKTGVQPVSSRRPAGVQPASSECPQARDHRVQQQRARTRPQRRPRQARS